MKKLLLLLSLAMAEAGCGNAPAASLGNAQRPTKEAEKSATTLQTVRIGGEKTTEAHGVPSVSARDVFRVRATYSEKTEKKAPPQAVIYIIRHEGGRDVIHNSSPAKRKSDGDVITYEGEIQAPPAAGEFRLEVKHAGNVLASSPLEVK